MNLLEDMIVGGLVGLICALISMAYRAIKSGSKKKKEERARKEQTAAEPQAVPVPPAKTVVEPAIDPPCYYTVGMPAEPPWKQEPPLAAAGWQDPFVRVDQAYSRTRWQLQALSGPLKGQVFPLNCTDIYQSYTIGRSPSCDISFPPNTPGVSGNHCRITLTQLADSLSVRVEDLNATYGTFLGTGVRLNPGQYYDLRNGDTFMLANGGPAFLVEEVSASTW